MAAIRERQSVAGVALAKEPTMMVKENTKKKETQDFATYLRRTSRNLKRGDFPPESWELRHSPFEDSAAQRRIAMLIAEIAERPHERQPAKARRKRR
jgi:hypothetical protein